MDRDLSSMQKKQRDTPALNCPLVTQRRRQPDAGGRADGRTRTARLRRRHHVRSIRNVFRTRRVRHRLPRLHEEVAFFLAAGGKTDVGQITKMRSHFLTPAARTPHDLLVILGKAYLSSAYFYFSVRVLNCAKEFLGPRKTGSRQAGRSR